MTEYKVGDYIKITTIDTNGNVFFIAKIIHKKQRTNYNVYKYRICGTYNRKKDIDDYSEIYQSSNWTDLLSPDYKFKKLNDKSLRENLDKCIVNNL